tara:strand:+ start:817 stop:1080 length:264 start_codon:yes stop_codon:yes gene_type:complete
MTLPYERYNAVKRTEEFLKELSDPRVTKRIPLEVRKQAYYLLKHFPNEYYMNIAAYKAPGAFAAPTELDPLTVLIHDYDLRTDTDES